MTTDRDRCVGVATSTVDTSSTGSETLMRRSASDSITATVPPPTTPFKTYGSLDSSLRDYATARRDVSGWPAWTSTIFETITWCA